MSLAAPLSDIFESREQANWVFDLMQRLLVGVGIKRPNDSRFAIQQIQEHGARAFNLYVADYVVFGFSAPTQRQTAVQAILADSETVPDTYVVKKRLKNGKAPLTRYDLRTTAPLETIATVEPQVHHAIRELVRCTFPKKIGRSPRRIDHNEQLGYAIFDTAERKALFTNGLTTLDSFTFVAQRFNRSSARWFVQSAEAEKQTVIGRFPRDGWATMPLEQYAMGGKGVEDNFCVTIERRTMKLGSMRGSTAKKFKVFYQKEQNEWYYPKQFSSEQGAWEYLRQQFVRLFELAEQGKWLETDKVNSITPMLRLKTLFVYFSNDVMPIYSPVHLKHFLKRLGVVEPKKSGVVVLNRQLLERLRSTSYFDGWNLIEVMCFLYWWDDPDSREDEFFTAVPMNDNETNNYAVLPIYLEIAEVLLKRGQLLFYGPPGTGKTFHARRFAQWWLRQDEPDAARVFHDDDFGKQVEAQLMAGQTGGQRVWWVVANPKQWKWDELFEDGEVDYDYGRLRSNYASVKAGDLVVGYQSTPDKRIVAIARVKRGLHEVAGEPKILLEPVTKVQNGLTYAELQQDEVLAQSEPLRNGCRGTLFKLTEAEAETLFEQLAERDERVRAVMDTANATAQLTQVTFHPSYTYEDFVEGFRPKPTTNGQLSLQLEAGVFKCICQDALAHPSRRYLLLIDEINRANLAKVFGELITLIEMDKRGMSLTLPQSRDPFEVPSNVYILGTMNTADRSIKLMDTALRRRFAFMEMMPDPSLLDDIDVDGLNMGDFLRYLNRRVVKAAGREKQIGHAALLKVETARDFGRTFRHDILPLLQEYSFDNFGQLEKWLGKKLVDAQTHTFKHAVLKDDAQLINALIQAIQ